MNRYKCVIIHTIISKLSTPFNCEIYKLGCISCIYSYQVYTCTNSGLLDKTR